MTFGQSGPGRKYHEKILGRIFILHLVNRINHLQWKIMFLLSFIYNEILIIQLRYPDFKILERNVI